MGIIKINLYSKNSKINDLTNLKEIEKYETLIKKFDYKFYSSLKVGNKYINFFYTKNNFAIELKNNNINLLIETNQITKNLLDEIIGEYHKLNIPSINQYILIMEVEENIDISGVERLTELGLYELTIKKYNFNNRKILKLIYKDLPYIYKLELSNNSNFNLISDKNKEEFKNYINTEEWISLNFTNKEKQEIQTNNIVGFIEIFDVWNKIIENKIEKTKRIAISEEIDKYKFNLKMKLWIRRNIYHSLIEKLENDKCLYFNSDFLLEIYYKCIEYKCKFKK